MFKYEFWLGLRLWMGLGLGLRFGIGLGLGLGQRLGDKELGCARIRDNVWGGGWGRADASVRISVRVTVWRIFTWAAAARSASS